MRDLLQINTNEIINNLMRTDKKQRNLISNVVNQVVDAGMSYEDAKEALLIATAVLLDKATNPKKDGE